MRRQLNSEMQKKLDEMNAASASKEVKRSLVEKYVPSERKCGCKYLKCHRECCHHDKRPKSACGCKKVLKKCLFKCGKTVTITCPGRYCLDSNIKFNPDEPGLVAITIDSDDVVLDLCGHVLKQGNAVKYTTGILIAEGRRNVTILGTYGAVRDFTEFGIRVRGHTSNVTIGDDTTLEVTRCGFADYQGEITFFGPFAPNGGNATSGIFIGDTSNFNNTQGSEGCNGVILKNVLVNQNSFMALGLFQSSAITVTGCSFDETSLSSPGPFTEAFVQVLNTFHGPGEKHNEDLSFTNCSFNRNRADFLPNANFYDLSVALPNGFDNLSFDKCSFNDNFSIGTVFAAGGASGNCATWTDCKMCGNKSDSRVEGFHISGDGFVQPVKNIVLIRCYSNDNIADLGDVDAPAFTFSIGFNILYADNLKMIDCQSNNNQMLAKSAALPTDGALGTAIFSTLQQTADFLSENQIIQNLQSVQNYTNTNGSAMGLDIDLNQQRIIVEGGQFSDNESLNGTGYGILMWNRPGFEKEPSIQHVVRNAVIQNNSTVGIEIQEQEKCLIEKNRIIDNGGDGILLSSGDSPSTKCWIRKNIIQYNAGVAVRDTQKISTNLVSENKAFGNQKLGGVVNPDSQYDVDYVFGHVPEVIGSLTTGYPSLPTDSMSNYSVNP